MAKLKIDFVRNCHGGRFRPIGLSSGGSSNVLRSAFQRWRQCPTQRRSLGRSTIFAWQSLQAEHYELVGGLPIRMVAVWLRGPDRTWVRHIVEGLDQDVAMPDGERMGHRAAVTADNDCLACGLARLVMATGAAGGLGAAHKEIIKRTRSVTKFTQSYAEPEN
jgi:hypothetical protein